VSVCELASSKNQNLGLWSARHTAYDHEQWREIVETATLLQGHATWWGWTMHRNSCRHLYQFL